MRSQYPSHRPKTFPDTPEGYADMVIHDHGWAVGSGYIDPDAPEPNRDELMAQYVPVMTVTIHGIEFVRRQDDVFSQPSAVEREAHRLQPNGGWVFFDGRFGACIHSEPPPENMHHIWPNHTWINRFWVFISADGWALVPRTKEEHS